MKTLSLKLPEELFAKLTAAAGKRGETRSAVVREAIQLFIKGNKYTSNASCLDLAKDLAGCVKGPPDLSFNKQRMREYGQ
ncbi:MAG: ribbon-helix-helix protein, CopG family [Deltaproteobacteria bacterium]|nr:ribbon-helix-helix protein, CopG family [Deltaproteobacteria bacterium]